jgi:hypothetical protein
MRQALVGLAGDLDGGAVDGDLAGVGQLGEAEQLGQDRGDRAAGAVARLVAGDDQVDILDRADRGGQHLGRLQDVGAVQRVVDDVHGLVRTHGQRLADGLGGPLRADAHDGDLTVVGLLDHERLLDGALVDLVEHRIGGVPVKGVVGVA